MICVTIARHSRRLALAGLVNAARMSADLVEVRLDAFEKPPDFAELVAAKRTPIMFSCRRMQDGGRWSGSELDRLALLRQALLAGPDYIAVEHDVADQIKRHGQTRRVICYTNTEETPADLGEIYGRCRELDPDVIHVTCKARTVEDAWPLLQLLKTAPLPTVVVGLGWQGIMPALLGRKHGAAWVTAAIERGSEAYPGQPTVRDLIDVYRYGDIDDDTKWVGVTGLGQWETLTIALLNATFVAQGSSKRCLPTPVGDADHFRKFAKRMHLRGVVVGPAEQAALRPLAATVDDHVHFASWSTDAEEIESAVDVLVPGQDGQWEGGSVFSGAAKAVLKATLKLHGKEINGLTTLFVGLSPATIGLARAIKNRGGRLIFADRDDNSALQHAKWFGGRHIRPEAIYTTMHDVTIVCAPPEVHPDLHLEDSMLHPGFLKPGMTLMDLTALPQQTPLLAEAAARGCAVVDPMELLFEYVRRLGYRLRGQVPPLTVMKETVDRLLTDALLSQSAVRKAAAPIEIVDPEIVE